jgi:hypothetical protein
VPSLLGIRARPNQTPNRKCRGRPDTTAAQRADRAVGRLRHSARSSKPGGCDPVAARHAAAAPRWATRRDTAAPTPTRSTRSERRANARLVTLDSLGGLGGGSHAKERSSPCGTRPPRRRPTRMRTPPTDDAARLSPSPSPRPATRAVFAAGSKLLRGDRRRFVMGAESLVTLRLADVRAITADPSPSLGAQNARTERAHRTRAQNVTW